MGACTEDGAVVDRHECRYYHAENAFEISDWVHILYFGPMLGQYTGLA